MNNNHLPLISIIVPVYNTANYLTKMIDSVIAQTYQNWELLLINDGSTDDSLKICESYSQKYSNILVFSQQNSGPSVARNLGIEKAKGDYICFVDSDDWVDDNYLEVFIQNLSSETMLVVQDHKRILDNGNKIIRYTNNHNNEYFDLPKDLSLLIKDYKYIQGYSVNKLYNRHLLNKYNLRFPERITMAEDEVFYYKYLKTIDKIIFVKPDTYNYVGRADSLTSKHAKFPSEFLLCLECNDFYHYVLQNDSSKENKLIFQKKFSRNFNHLLRTILYWEDRKDYTNNEKVNLLKKMYNAYQDSLPYLKGNTFLQKLDYFLFKKKMFRILDFILRLKMKYN